MAETRKNSKVARRAFAEYGYADTSMDKLTAEAGLTRVRYTIILEIKRLVCRRGRSD